MPVYSYKISTCFESLTTYTRKMFDCNTGLRGFTLVNVYLADKLNSRNYNMCLQLIDLFTDWFIRWTNQVDISESQWQSSGVTSKRNEQVGNWIYDQWIIFGCNGNLWNGISCKALFPFQEEIAILNSFVINYSRLVSLQFLSVDNNHLESVPTEICHLINLTELHLSNNQISR